MHKFSSRMFVYKEKAKSGKKQQRRDHRQSAVQAMDFTRSIVETERKLEEIVRLDVERKSLIKLAVMQAINTCQKYKQHNAETDKKVDAAPPAKSSHDYELTISRLRQEQATKDKVYESRIEALNEEIFKLKDQTFSEPFPAPTSRPASTGSRESASSSSLSSYKPGLSFSTSPYLNKVNTTSRSYLSPTINSLSRSIASVPSPYEQATILSPIQAKKKAPVPQASAKPKRTYTNFNTLKRMNPGGPSVDEIIKGRVLKQLNVPNARRANLTLTDDDNSTGSEAPTTTVITATSVTTTLSEPNTPTKSVGSIDNDAHLGGEGSSSFDESQGPFSAGTSMATSDDDFYASANSTLNHLDTKPTSKEDKGVEPTKKKVKKKVQLSKSGARKLSQPEAHHLLPSDTSGLSFIEHNLNNDNSPNKGLNLEDEESNTLNYYQDSNWAEDNDATPKRGHKRIGSSEGGNKKRKRIIFKIE